jgi:antitoxin ParD1/3/4
MGKIEKISVALTPELASMVREAVERGSYASTSEVIRDALRVWKQRAERHDDAIAEIRQLWQEGLESGSAADGKIVMARLKRRYAETRSRKRA